MPTKVYISGKITGLLREELVEKFRAKEKELAAEGFEVVNPLNNGLPFDAEWKQHMREDLKALLNCDILYLMSDWRHSPGANLEHTIADNTGIPIVYEPEEKEKK